MPDTFQVIPSPVPALCAALSSRDAVAEEYGTAQPNATWLLGRRAATIPSKATLTRPDVVSLAPGG
mgnify:CR=1 FL=1